MSDTPRSIAAIVAALQAGAAAFAKLLTDADTNAIPVNVHVAHGHLATYAADAAEFALVVSETPAGTDTALTDRVTHLETLMVEGGTWFPPAAPAPVPAAAPAAPAVTVVPGATNPAL